MRVLIAAGGTGGHLLPGVAAAKALRARGHLVHFLVKQDGRSPEYLAREGFPSTAFHFEGFPRGLNPALFTYPLKLMTAWGAARRTVRRERPDVFLGMGGYVSAPAGLAARGAGVPIVLHEQNTRAGLANRVLSRWARVVATSFESTEGLSPRAVRREWTGLPLRPDLVPLDPAEARLSLGLDPEAPTLLVFGGSQGARALNRWAVEALNALPAQPRWQVIHLTGPTDEEPMRAAHERAGRRAFVKGFWPGMAAAYSAADYVIARAGANTVMELWRVGRPALLVPFPFATDDHQTHNAAFLAERGQARVVAERALRPDTLSLALASLPPLAALRADNAARAKAAPPLLMNAAERLADVVESEGTRAQK
ncbi:MAG: undecaprenyldiphospho-muramoylpentapeptide beta-N-acetylglucosaminyltransferase [Elusimicrobia bacterium]|jgi:UDP-N-acetylglucosamine--N-acetylmuramyl-(pentapeptide) pyrophosphoryl-undecaprenol N-acetylglucosamine transferase|nr:undecaprenyldiphospho-muramoylpentapeptide beta-N-acetylglucosaminyltransferase [Elusimicrobiota bacterium]MBK7206934.1 undecaprenyldiphospho-muramoylpentapeptide beta-N-acetylglucosaminyltransferase [Elusimicrobiota bacterium]MBK7545754.1 undecaprenyldiphospho-muramoylpentapeptide beta-N-acetylglucosaminyltransferase [Elusimicrobiota bacterium]MBK7575018.1 undecaprenyldiphospho-muramoylpentapeptide beta-N-acetylglucosaminyltransferase [Elusimicrobiota bacterium]MBK7687716.1 undecaprenyldiph